EYYRDQLLTFGDEVEWKALGDIAIIKNGKTYKKFCEGNIPVYGSGGVMTYIDTFVYDKPTVLIPRKGSIDKLYYLDIPFWNVDTVFYTILDENAIKAKFLFYYLKSQRLERLNTAGGVPSLTQAVLKLIQIPLPSLSEQARIVSILDKFDTLVNDISAGIPAEIEARKQQYEYYREKLLSFKELG
ncbi:MAG: restriction endonuclease subunit S, partial [Candidatus Cloacimonetes bacterium]|nr:restriction endonuclease subunit S [Candidatus Cloacimonadota bacterium]